MYAAIEHTGVVDKLLVRRRCVAMNAVCSESLGDLEVIRSLLLLLLEPVALDLLLFLDDHGLLGDSASDRLNIRVTHCHVRSCTALLRAPEG